MLREKHTTLSWEDSPGGQPPVPGAITLFPVVTDLEVSHVLLLLYIHPSSHKGDKQWCYFPQDQTRTWVSLLCRIPRARFICSYPFSVLIKPWKAMECEQNSFLTNVWLFAVNIPIWHCADNKYLSGCSFGEIPWCCFHHLPQQGLFSGNVVIFLARNVQLSEV